ncbi:hypothetical protein [Hymenobacter cheonanensis]|uniref:hypothetical protein n=1 Tax=Hymenobacter sp. CA2-7 TaxID=3063993 RepID=UPI002712DBDB|nr:hypothetical protein [Hymenobacter sp. CA2-7]MDO7888242.1 hypothetical protein [Hymenobacter sp. CA2-7]
MLRKLAPYLIFISLGVAMLAGAVYAPVLIAKFYHAVPSASPAASSAEIAAGQQASGWVPSATVASKFIAFAGMYLLLVLLPWVVQHLTHPAPTLWAKTRYSREFLGLSDEARFAVYGRLQLTIVIRAAASALFAALVV